MSLALVEADSPPTQCDGDPWAVALGLSWGSTQGCHSEAHAVTAAAEQEETNTHFVKGAAHLHTKPVCWKQCAKQCLGLLLGLVLYQRRVNKFKTDLAAFLKTTFLLLLLRKQKSAGLLAKEKCRKWHKCFYTLWSQVWGRGVPGDVEAHPHTSSPSSTGQLAVPLANTQGKARSLSLMCSS